MTQVFASETMIGRPRAEVWAALTDWDRAPGWMDGVESLRADGPVEPGTTLTFRTGGRDRSSSIGAADPGRSLVIRSQLRGVSSEYAYELHDDEAGGTRVTLVAQCTATGVHRLLGPALRDAMRRTDSGQLEALRSLVEGA